MSSQVVNKNGLGFCESLRVLAVADVVQPQLYNNAIKEWIGPVDLLISCGDLPPHYLDFLASVLSVPFVHVLGNHCYVPHDPVTGRCSPEAYLGAYNLNGRVAEYDGLIMAGAEGSPFYNAGPHQYTEAQMAWNLLRLFPALMREKLFRGRYLDVLVTHSPPKGIHDNTDVAHRGFESLLIFIERYRPALMLHGHTHRYDPMLPLRTRHGDTEIINVYGHCLLELARDARRPGWHISAPEQLEVRNGRQFTQQGGADSA